MHAATRLFGQLCRALTEHGEVVIRVVDLGHRQGFTDYGRGVIFIDHRLTLAGARAALCHELTHLRRGPAPGRAAEEEHQVRRETARILAPDVTALRRVARVWSRAELAAFATLGCGDLATVRDAASLQTGEIPIQRLAEGAA